MADKTKGGATYPVIDPEDGAEIVSQEHALKVARARFGKALDEPKKLPDEAQRRLRAIGALPPLSAKGAE
jgi:hypothetical protein